MEVSMILNVGALVFLTSTFHSQLANSKNSVGRRLSSAEDNVQWTTDVYGTQEAEESVSLGFWGYVKHGIVEFYRSFKCMCIALIAATVVLLVTGIVGCIIGPSGGKPDWSGLGALCLSLGTFGVALVIIFVAVYGVSQPHRLDR